MGVAWSLKVGGGCVLMVAYCVVEKMVEYSFVLLVERSVRWCFSIVCIGMRWEDGKPYACEFGYQINIRR